MAHTTQSQTAPYPARNSDTTHLGDWLARQAEQDTLRFITCGSVDDGKSTLIGRLLWESHHIFDDQLAAVTAASKRHGTQGDNIDLALLLDGLSAEREQGITIDVAYRFFGTARRKFIVADTPGHEQYTRNMVTGASTADLAVILIDARKGLLMQTRRHARLVSLMGIRHITLAINKMDLVGFDAKVFERIAHDFGTLAEGLQFGTVTAIPISALQGDNITTRSARTPWYSGPTLLGYLETAQIHPATDQRLVFPVQYVNRPQADFRGLSGTVASGRIAVGTAVRVTASGQTAQIKRIITPAGDASEALPGSSITVVLDKEVDASRGDILASADAPLEMTDQFTATVIWMHEDKGMVGRNYELKLAGQWSGASLTSIKHRIDVNTGAHESCRQLGLNDIAACNLALSRPVVFDAYITSHTLGAFILVDRFTQATVAAGLITHNLRRADNVHRQALSITLQDRERLNGHKGKVIWFTGLSGSGKSTIANALEKELHAQGKRTYILDGDNIRQGLNRDLGFTDADRVENIRRVAEVAKLMMDAGLIVMTAFISPFRQEREMARALIGKENFVEVFVATPLTECERRDPKGLYKKARNGLLPNMTGISSPYEQPNNPSVVIETAANAIDGIVKQLLQELSK
ncbi:sulfate adenylyltransferase subunit CysN [Acidovorax sp. 1608163]|uniref:sulfate adenylyltransferase subunit CysN n=1 Tax=Acidovorax sp. 1608163 TaxID=2478662 RepID=UPI000EF6D99A|nr:sulfate adenylyltransferase subunit CysN [Acidovorax sp. 1608163]AYM97593.1 sulfate adenylyltransferase subunit CysN [Acidovorax sp. 1608163]